ncbi:MAG: hypothetical protein A2452_11165 [Candidatus Firestonebacteria bacterium RIFOXYC2_FULL_39_67]|nr:MAG: hypothetical protein A2452_11165 [Candidatus Firestonebacteria bacterium RIFOXYC2_FULL_39_67]
MDDIVKQIGIRIRELREEKGYSKTKLAKLSGVHIAWVGRLEQGSRETGKVISPSIITLNKIAVALETNLENLINTQPVKNDSNLSDRVILKKIKTLLKNQNLSNKRLFLDISKKVLRK